MNIRRVVTGQATDGKAVFTSDDQVEPFTPAPGLEIAKLWAEDKIVSLPVNGVPNDCPAPFPPTNGFRFSVITMPPKDGAPAEQPPGKGMHATDTIDLIYVISGEIYLELDDGQEKLLKSGDTIVLNGSVHDWHNRGAVPCKMVSCSVGASRE